MCKVKGLRTHNVGGEGGMVPCLWGSDSPHIRICCAWSVCVLKTAAGPCWGTVACGRACPPDSSTDQATAEDRRVILNAVNRTVLILGAAMGAAWDRLFTASAFEGRF